MTLHDVYVYTFCSLCSFSESETVLDLCYELCKLAGYLLLLRVIVWPSQVSTLTQVNTASTDSPLVSHVRSVNGVAIELTE